MDPNQLLAAPNQQQSGSPKQLPGPARGGTSKSPTPIFLLGLFMTMAWIILMFVDLEASEATFTHVKVTSFTPEWSLVLQLPEILVGKNMPLAEAQAAVVGWVLLICTLTCVVGYDLAKESVKHANHRLEKVFGAGVLILAGYDFVANLLYGPGGSSPFSQFIFAVVVTFAGFFFGIPGFRMLEHSLKIWWSGH